MTQEVATRPKTETEETDLRTPHLSLPKSGLSLEGGVLVRKTREGTVIGSHPLREISGLQLVRSFSFSTLLIGLGLGAASIAAKVYIESNAWGWIVGGGLALLATCLILASWGQNLRIESGGTVANYNLFDQDEDCQGFVLSLTNVWKKSR